MTSKAKRIALRRLDAVWSHALLIVLCVIWLIPIVWVILAAFKAEPGVASTTLFPKSYTFDNFVNLINPKGDAKYSVFFGKWYLNTIIIAALNCIASTIITLGAAYAMSRFRFKMRKGFMNIALILGMFPGFMAMIAIYLILDLLKLIDNSFSLLLVYAAGAGLGFYVSKGYFDTVSKSLDEAAQIDGATQARVFFSIILPLSKPIIIYTAVTAFMTPWMDFILASMILRTPEAKTVAVGLYGMIMENADLFNNFTMFAAGCVLVSLPIVTFYVIMQRYMIAGISAGAVKQ